MAAQDEPRSPWVRGLRVAREPASIVVLVAGRIDRRDAGRLSDQVRELLDGCEARQLICDVGSLEDPDAAAVDAICRIKLVASRRGCRLWLQDPSPELVELLDLVGLGDVVPARSRFSRRVGAAARTAGTSGRCQGRT